MKKVLILGGGSAGVMFANRMVREFSRDEAEVTVIERSKEHIYQPAFTLVVFGLDDPENLVRPTKDLFFEGVNLIFDEATKIDPEKKTVTTANSGDLAYDYLVICTGSKLFYDEPEGIEEGLKKGENVFNFYTMDGSIKLRDALKNFEGGTIVSTVCEMPIKCPAAPMKFIMMAEDTMRKKGIREKCKFVFTTPLPAVFSKEPYATTMDKIYSTREIEAISNFAPATVDYENGVVEDFGGQKVEFDLLCITPRHGGDDVIENSPGVGDAAGWIPCDKNLMVHKKFDSIYSLGDANDFPTSKTASGARKQAKILTRRMKAHIRGGDPNKHTYDGHIICPILTRYGRVMFAEFNYTESISPGIESYANWMIKVHMLRPLYWNLMLNGLV
jgi:sulfide:quinone oxidoreductase